MLSFDESLEGLQKVVLLMVMVCYGKQIQREKALGQGPGETRSELPGVPSGGGGESWTWVILPAGMCNTCAENHPGKRT